jgi:5-methylcytosine-specific restriction endonuclease McrA
MALKTLGPRLAAAPRSRIARLPSEGGKNAAVYQSPEWRAFVGEIKRERGCRCEDCGETEGRIQGDHIIEIEDGGAVFDKANVRLRCTPCGNAKTARERRARMEHG